jgi:HYR domain
MRPLKVAFCLILVGIAIFCGRIAQGAGSTLSRPEIASGPATWTSETSAEFSFTSPDSGVVFRCRLDQGSWDSCSSPLLYSSLSEGPHTFQVRAVDESTVPEEQSPPRSWGWTVDLTPPSIPPDMTVEATSPLGTPVTFTATDNLDPAPLLSCAPASASAFALGTTEVTCTATDAAGNSSPEGVFKVTVVDTTPPVLAPHDDVLATQESPAGASVIYEPPAVTDNGDSAPDVNCAPASGGTFPIGTTRVTCLAVDAANNTSSAQFDVIVQQGAIPRAPALGSDVGVLTRKTTAHFTFSYADGLTAECRLDSSTEAGSFGPCDSQVAQTYTGLADGNYLFTLRVTNSIGNVNQATHSWTVDTSPPIAVLGSRTRFGNGWIRVVWNKPTDIDYSHVTIWRKRVGATSWKRLGTRRARSTFLDEPVPNDVRFVYSLRSFDVAGNGSPPVTVAGRASRILSPRYGAVLSSPPLVDWTSVRNATYFNMQLWRSGRKILSVWPSRSSYRLQATWRYGGRRYSLGRARYRIYVWPGFGAKSAVDYGRLLGWTSFTVD